MEPPGKKTNEPRDPLERLKFISNANTSIEVDPHIPPTRYYRSGVEMIRMANVYYEEGNLENAYMLYLKYMTLFIEKIRKHPNFSSVPLNMRSSNQQTLRQIVPKAEKLRQQLLDQYTKEYEDFKIIKQKAQLEEMKKKARREEEQRARTTTGNVKIAGSSTNWGTTVILAPKNIDSISYPDTSVNSNEFDRTRSSSTKGIEAKSLMDDKVLETLPKHKTVSLPVIDRSNKPSATSSSTSLSGFRTVVIPSSLSTKFLVLAGKNTLNNIETCGILAGILEHNQLIITHLIVPKQKGSADSCATTNEEEIFDLQDQFGLITIGWIHTHPTQTAFLSSVDLHTHCPYQLLMPEAIAIVCAPKYNDTGIFILTPNYGLDFIANCRSTGFHPHPTEPALFTSASHIKMDPASGVDVLDLRAAN